MSNWEKNHNYYKLNSTNNLIKGRSNPNKSKGNNTYTQVEDFEIMSFLDLIISSTGTITSTWHFDPAPHPLGVAPAEYTSKKYLMISPQCN